MPTGGNKWGRLIFTKPQDGVKQFQLPGLCFSLSWWFCNSAPSVTLETPGPHAHTTQLHFYTAWHATCYASQRTYLIIVSSTLSAFITLQCICNAYNGWLWLHMTILVVDMTCHWLIMHYISSLLGKVTTVLWETPLTRCQVCSAADCAFCFSVPSVVCWAPVFKPLCCSHLKCNGQLHPSVEW